MRVGWGVVKFQGPSFEANQAIAVCRGGLSEGCFAVVSSSSPLEETAASEEGLLPCFF